MKKLIITSLAILSLAACGKETVIKEVLVTTPPTEAPAVTEAPVTNKYDLYLEELYAFSAQARSWDEADLLKFGTVVCDALDTGNTLDSIINIMSDYSSGSYDDELFAGIILGSVKHICPEHMSYVQSQI
jgi:hypothetical protein